jgi:hypothetical protein
MVQTANFVCKGVAVAARAGRTQINRIWVCRPAAGFAIRTGQHAVSEVPDNVVEHPGRRTRDDRQRAAGGHA